MVLVIVGAGLLYPQRREPPHTDAPDRSAGSPCCNPACRFCSSVSLFVGGIFGSFEVVTVAFAQEQDATS